MSAGGNNELLRIGSSEIKRDLPVGLKYFMAVDAMLEGSTILRGIYFNILVYGPNSGDPAVKILRTQHKYQDGNVGRQDEIELSGKEYRLQFNAETDSQGAYVQYPGSEGSPLREMAYLNSVVDTFTALGKKDGSQIIINNNVKMIARNGLWEVVYNQQGRPPQPPTFGSPPEALPGQDNRLLPGDDQFSPFASFLNVVLGLATSRIGKSGRHTKTHYSSGD